MRGITVAAETYPRTVFCGRDLYVRTALRIDEAKKDRFGVSGSAVRHFDGRIRGQYFDFGTNPTLLIDKLEFTTAQDRRNVLRRSCAGMNHWPEQQSQIHDCQAEQNALRFHVCQDGAGNESVNRCTSIGS